MNFVVCQLVKILIFMRALSGDAILRWCRDWVLVYVGFACIRSGDACIHAGGGELYTRRGPHPDSRKVDAQISLIGF